MLKWFAQKSTNRLANQANAGARHAGLGNEEFDLIWLDPKTYHLKEHKIEQEMHLLRRRTTNIGIATTQIALKTERYDTQPKQVTGISYTHDIDSAVTLDFEGSIPDLDVLDLFRAALEARSIVRSVEQEQLVARQVA